jgi:HEAT repeat protein
MLTRFALLTLMATWLLLDNAAAADSNAEKTQKLVAVLQSDASFYDKARACQQLGEFGDKKAVAALAALLADEHLSAYARSGLEGIPDASAAEALRTAAGNLKGKLLVGVINSLGVLRDSQAVGLLKKLVTDPTSGVAREALLALGRIATDESIEVVRDALIQGSETNRTDAAAACLLAAEKRFADGHDNSAMALYDAVRQTSIAPSYRAAATRGAIVARRTKGIPLLVEQLRSDDRVLRHAALTSIREIPSDALANALNAELSQASVELQVQLLTALVDCYNAQSLSVLHAKIASEHAEVRKAALTTLGRIGGDPGVLIEAIAANRSTEESAIALNSLRQMEGAAMDAKIVQSLVSARDVELRVQLIRLLGNRATANAAGELLKQAADSDARISVAALRALKSLAGPADLPALIALTRSSKDPEVREAAENAVVGSSTRTGNGASASDAVLTELKQANDPLAKNSWIRILVSLGSAQALPVILATMNDPIESVAVCVIEQLGRWPDPAPIDDLLADMRVNTNSARQKRALASVIQLATAAADERQRPDEILVKWFRLASQMAQTTEEQRLIVSGLGRLKHLESLRLLARYLENPELKNEAAVAIVQIAPAIRQTNPADLKKALLKIAATGQTADIRQQAAKIAGTIPD